MPAGCSTAVATLRSSFPNTFCGGGRSPGLSGRSPFTDFISSPASPSKSRAEPRNWSETFAAPTSSGTGGLWLPGGARISAGSSHSQGHRQSLPEQETRLRSPRPVPTSSAARVLSSLTIFHQPTLPCELTSFLEATGGIRAGEPVQGEPLRSRPPLKPEVLS